ncbi:MAG: hypothetical protein ACREPE_12540, partial [Lysobacter sp.]
DTFSDVIRISEDALRQQYHAAPAKPKLEGRSVGPMLGISRSSQNYDGEDERAEAVYEQQMRDRADQAIESTVCDLIEPRIMAEFSQQAWNDHDEAVTLCTDQFDATDYVLAMPLEEIQQLA